jgi:peroxiredoxin
MLRTLCLIFVAATLSACSTLPNTAAKKPVYETYVKVGQTMPLKQVVDYKGAAHQLDQIGKRKLVLLFATWCSDSQRAFKQILASPLASDPNLIIVGIGREDDAEKLAKFEKDYAVKFTLVADPKRDIYKQYANAGIPRIILIDEKNVIVKTLIGESQRAIDEIVWP